jgi:membrane peptidoglycan carboxypeptidase
VDGSLFGDSPRAVESVERIRSRRVDDNLPEPTEVMEAGEAENLTSMLEDVVRSGTGVRAAVPGVQVAGKTGTTDNYADAWFVGFTPEIAVAVWVGYPDELVPMRTEYGGEPVTGGTLPALIWKEFVTRYEKAKRDSTEEVSFDGAPYLGAVPMWVVKRGGNWVRDNQYCRGSKLIVFFSGRGPEDFADCKPNEVSVPTVVGMREASAVATLAAQPLGAKLVYKPARAGRTPGTVLDQMPRAGGLSANDDVTLVVSKARYGLLPNFVGSSFADVQRELKRLKLRGRVSSADGDPGVVLRQTPGAGVSVAPGLVVKLVVGDG